MLNNQNQLVVLEMVLVMELVLVKVQESVQA